MKPIILYDIPGNSPECKAWSPSTWKVRYALNYKGLPLKTEWVEYPDIADLYHKLDLAPTAQSYDGSPLHTLPVIHDPNTNRTISESLAIVKYLDTAYPATPTLLPEGTLAFHTLLLDTTKLLAGPWYNLVCCAVWTRLPARSQVFYRETREARFGKRLEEMRGEDDLEKAEKAFAMMDAWFRANAAEGVGRDELMMGKQVCFADVVFAANLKWGKTALGEESEEWKRIMGWNDGRWKRLLERFAQYEVVDL